MSDFRILLDVDGVLGDFIGHTLKGMGTLWNPAELPCRDDFKTWNLFDTITDEEQQKFCNRLWRKKGWCNAIPPFPDAIHAVNRLRNNGEIYAVTAPLSKSSHWVNERYEWLQHWFFIPPENVIFAYDKGVISGDLFVDDKPANVCRWASYFQGRSLLWSASYNQSEALPPMPNVARVYGWEQVHNEVFLQKLLTDLNPTP